MSQNVLLRLIGILTLPMVMSVEATESTSNVWASLSYTQFHYEEDQAGRLLDEEDGGLPGFALGVDYYHGQWFLAAEGHYQQATVDYAFFPMAGAPIESNTDERILEVVVAGGRRIDFAQKINLTFYAGLGNRYWHRNISSTATAFGLDEKYRWTYGLLGVRPQFQLDDKNRLEIDLRLRQVLSSSLDVTFKNGIYDPVTLDLDNGEGLRLSLEWTRRFGNDFAFGLRTFLDLWSFDASKQVPFSRQGIPEGTIQEPANETSEVGVMLILRRSF